MSDQKSKPPPQKLDSTHRPTKAELEEKRWCKPCSARTQTAPFTSATA